jgi:hypothetical protein
MHAFDPYRTESRQLAYLFESADDPQALWRPEELRAIWQHQLAASIEYDLGGLTDELTGLLQALVTPAGSPARSFGDLLQHPAPPVELLDLIKRFAKEHWTHPDSLLPRSISMALYYAAIAAAMVRLGKKISSFEEATLRQGLQRVAGLDWLDIETRSLLENARAALENSP